MNDQRKLVTFYFHSGFKFRAVYPDEEIVWRCIKPDALYILVPASELHPMSNVKQSDVAYWTIEDYVPEKDVDKVSCSM